MKRQLFFAAWILLSFHTFADDIRYQTEIVDVPSADYIKICGWEFDVEGGGHSVCEVDINGDGVNDFLFANAGTSGTGGFSSTVYLSRPDGRYLRAGTIGHGAISLVEDKANGNILHCGWSFGGGHMSITSFRISARGIAQIETIGGRSDERDFAELYKRLFEGALDMPYQFVPNEK